MTRGGLRFNPDGYFERVFEGGIVKKFKLTKNDRPTDKELES